MDSPARYRWAAWTLIVCVSVLRLTYLALWCPLDLSPDEAYYWDWSRQLDWSYHSKGPLVAWLIRLSCECFGNTMLAVRLPAVICGGFLLLGVFTLTREVYQSDRLAFGVVALALTLPIIAAGSLLMTIDAPFTCAWIWATVFAYRAVFGSAPWAWVASGLCIMAGLLAKHTMVLWPASFMLFLCATPELRGHLRRPGWWIMNGIGALGAVPIVVWNLMNGWVTLTHTRYHAGIDDDVMVSWIGPLRYVGAQLGVLLGFWFVVWVIAMWQHRPTVESRPAFRFLWWMSAPTFAFFGLFAFKNGGGQANWPAVAYMTGMVLAAGWLADQSKRIVRFLVLGFAAVGLLLTVVLHEPPAFQPIFLQMAGPATPKHPQPIRRVDPTCRLRGWQHLATEVDRMRADLRARGIEPVLAAQRWTQAAELAFYCDGQPQFYYLGQVLEDRECQYDLWRPNPVADPERFLDRTFLIVGAEVERHRNAFRSLERVQTVTYCENSHAVAEWQVVIAHGFCGWGKVDRLKMD